MDLKSLKALIEGLERDRSFHLGRAAEIDRDIAALAAQVARISEGQAEADRIAAKYGAQKKAATEPPPSDFKDSAEPRQDGGSFDGTFGGLQSIYRAHPESPIHNLRHSTKRYYGVLLNRFDTEPLRSTKIDGLTEDDIIKIHAGWLNGGKVAMAHALITMARQLATFGTDVLKDDRCLRLSYVLHRMKFEQPKPRTEQLTAEQVSAIIQMARKMKMTSIALAQALQFYASIRQKDVIGEWVPLTDPEESKIEREGDLKWVRGITHEEIVDDVLRHTTSKDGKLLEIDLRKHPIIIELLTEVREKRRSGPLIVAEHSQVPWVANEFRRKWRIIARKCKIPDTVRNSDSFGSADADPEVVPEPAVAHVVESRTLN